MQAVRSVDSWPMSRARAVLRDVHFWVPVAVLLAGLLVLRWLA
jgi:hypothetical protein